MVLEARTIAKSRSRPQIPSPLRGRVGVGVKSQHHRRLSYQNSSRWTPFVVHQGDFAIVLAFRRSMLQGGIRYYRILFYWPGRGGGIGRHAVLRGQWASACVGSNPALGTTFRSSVSASISGAADVKGDVAKWLRRRSAKPLCGGSNPPVASNSSPRRARQVLYSPSVSVLIPAAWGGRLPAHRVRFTSPFAPSTLTAVRALPQIA